MISKARQKAIDLNRKANDIHSKGNSSKAAKLWNEVIQTDPSFWKPYYNLGLFYDELVAPLHSQKEYYERAFSRAPEKSKRHIQYRMANYYYHIRDFKQALVLYKESLQKDPNDPHCNWGAGASLFMIAGQVGTPGKEVLDYMLKAAERDKKYLDTFVNIVDSKNRYCRDYLPTEVVKRIEQKAQVQVKKAASNPAPWALFGALAGIGLLASSNLTSSSSRKIKNYESI